ncbi:CPBP family intramembrane glutamic endopeptidase [Schleiferilactobacillus shenzhenensis]|nr:CPBP family intramembrane glutamic endopeptidase [Schleiferilactobacillus shenzhenensis]
MWMVFSFALLVCYVITALFGQKLANGSVAHLLDSSAYIGAIWATRWAARKEILGSERSSVIEREWTKQGLIPPLFIIGLISVLGLVYVFQIVISPVIYSGVGYIAVAWGEETLYRGYIMNSLTGSFSKTRANLIQAAMFAFLSHVGGFENMLFNLIVRFPMGLLLGYIAQKTHSLRVPMLIHWLYNTGLDLLSI